MGRKYLPPRLAAGWQEDAQRPYLVCPGSERQLTSWQTCVLPIPGSGRTAAAPLLWF